VKSNTKTRNSEAGFALLFVFAMAATVAITLLIAMPSNAFEAQRQREQLLIDRGEQYTRGIQLYVRKFNRYPADFEALENTQGQRFLRKRYQDPLTGKDEWRLIHVGPGGVFTDSLLYTKKKDPNAPEKQTFITEIPTVVDPTGTTGVNIATRRIDPNNPGQQLPGSPVSVNPSFPTQSPLPGQSLTPIDPNNPQQSIPGGLPSGVQFPPGVQPPPGVQIPGNTNTPNFPGTGQGGAATNLINQLLTTPRPGGLNGLGTTGTQQTNLTGGTVDAFGNPVQQAGTATATTNGTQAVNGAQPMAGSTIGGGIAGVASKLEQEGIKRYRERALYNEWEFVYDLTKDTSRTGGAVPQTASMVNGNASATSATTTGTTAPAFNPAVPSAPVAPPATPAIPPQQ
jgi:hypothetical protein